MKRKKNKQPKRGTRTSVAPTRAREGELLRELRHQINNSLQGIAGLLALHAAREPEAAAALRCAQNQIHAIAHVYALQGRNRRLRLGTLVEAIAAGLRGRSSLELELHAAGADWTLPERSAVPVALAANEIIWNALRHRDPGRSEPVGVRLERGTGGEALLRVRNPGRLAGPGNRREADAGGLELVRALLPRNVSRLDLREDGGWVEAELGLRPPAVR